MKVIISFICITILSLSNNCLGQSKKSDLRIKVDSIIKYEIKYEIDSTTGRIDRKVWSGAGIAPASSSLSSNPLPLIIYKKRPVNLKYLNKKKLKRVKEILVYPKNDSITQVIYGSLSKNGLIIIN